MTNNSGKNSLQNPIPPSFFNRDSIIVARDLLGMSLVRKMGHQIVRCSINEIEVYDGFKDKASHAYKGKTKRNSVMFGPAGYFYVYLIYGMYWMLNIVTGPKDYPAALLIRGAGEFNGPGKLTRVLSINKSLNNKKCSRDSGLWFQKNENEKADKKIIKTNRIGVQYAGPVWSKRKLRFIYKVN